MTSSQLYGRFSTNCHQHRTTPVYHLPPIFVLVEPGLSSQEIVSYSIETTCRDLLFLMSTIMLDYQPPNTVNQYVPLLPLLTTINKCFTINPCQPLCSPLTFINYASPLLIPCLSMINPLVINQPQLTKVLTKVLIKHYQPAPQNSPKQCPTRNVIGSQVEQLVSGKAAGEAVSMAWVDHGEVHKAYLSIVRTYRSGLYTHIGSYRTAIGRTG